MASYCAPRCSASTAPGITGADCATRSKIPRPLSQFLQLMLFFSVVAGLPYYYGRMIGNTKHAWNIWAIMFDPADRSASSSPGTSSRAPTRAWRNWASTQSSANMEGKEVRIGIYNSAAWANDVTDDRRGGQQLPARFHDAADRVHAAVQHAHGRGDLRRDRQRPVHDARLHLRLRLPGRTDDRQDAGVPGQEDRGVRRQMLLAVAAHDRDRHGRASPPGRASPTGDRPTSATAARTGSANCSTRTARERQQRHGVRRVRLFTDRPNAAGQTVYASTDIQLDADLLHADRAVLRD